MKNISGILNFISAFLLGMSIRGVIAGNFWFPEEYTL